VWKEKGTRDWKKRGRTGPARVPLALSHALARSLTRSLLTCGEGGGKERGDRAVQGLGGGAGHGTVEKRGELNRLLSR